MGTRPSRARTSSRRALPELHASYRCFRCFLCLCLCLCWWTEQRGTDGLGYALIDWVEETLEMVGVVLALVALVAHHQESRR